MAYDIGPKIGIDGEAEFRAQLSNINTSLKTLGTEMKVVTSEFIGQEKSVESLSSQNEVLRKTAAQLEEKLKLQKEMLQKATEAYGEADSRTQKWQQAVNNTTAELNKANAQIKSNEKAVDDLGKEEEETGKKTSTFGDVLKANLASEAITGAVKAIGSAVKDLGLKLLNAATDAGCWADELNTQAEVTGISTEQLQKYAFAAKQVDVSVDTIAGSMSKLTKNMNAARDGSGAAAEGFAALGISVTDSTGALRSNDDVFSEAIAALGKIENETERDAVAMQIFGKSAQDLNPLILGGAEALDEYSRMAEQAGLILSQEDLDGLNQISDALDTFKGTASSAGNLLMTKFAAPISDAINTLTGDMQRLTAAFAENGFDGLVTEAKSMSKELLTSITNKLPQAMEKGTEILMNIVQGILNAAPELLTAAVEMITTLATGIGDALPVLIPAAIDAIIQFALGLTSPDSIQNIINAALQLILGLVQGIVKAIPELMKAVPQIYKNIWSALTSPETLKMMADAGIQIVKGLWEGIKGMAAWLWERVSGFFSGIVDGVKDFLGIHSPSRVFASIGKNMALGLGEGWGETIEGIKRGMEGSVMISAFAGGYPQIAGVPVGTQGGAEVVINLTSQLDGLTLARNQYRYNMAEMARHGGSLVGGA